MTTPAPDKDRFPYPTNTVVAIARDSAATAEALRRLNHAGFSDDHIDMLHGSDGAKRIDPTGEGHGAKGQHKRRTQNTWGDDAANAREYAEQLQGGAQLIAVSVSDRKQAQRAAGAVSDAGLIAVRYYSRYTVESL